MGSKKEKIKDWHLAAMTFPTVFLSVTLPPLVNTNISLSFLNYFSLVKLCWMCEQGDLNAATDLAVEYMEAVMGRGGEYFGIDKSLQANTR